ncbi:MAG: hypothetical protein U1E88_04795 [Acinetobacter sp.]
MKPIQFPGWSCRRKKKRITNVKAGTADTDAVNKKQLDTALTNIE